MPNDQLKPVAGQSRFTSPKSDWQPCSYEHHLMVTLCPHEWPDYETRALYALSEDSVVVPADYTPVKTEAVLFLLGLGTEPFTQPEGKGKFWWRQRLHEAIPGGLEAMLAEDKKRHSPT